MSDYRHPDRFLGLDDASSGRESSAAWLLPIPLDMTTSYVGGTRFGPAAIIEASNQVELYDSTVGVEAAPLYGIYTLPFFHPTLASAVEAFEAIAEAVADLPLKGRLLVALGGEHSITPGVVRALSPEYHDLVLVQIDAHCDLRDSFDGTPWSHACAARRALDHVAKILQFGIRSVCPEEVEFLRSTDRVKVWTAEAMHRDVKRRYLDELRKSINGRPVYLSIDLDGLDPSVVPAVGTPEPGGIGWYDCLDLIRAVTESGTVIAFDCVELCPSPGNQVSAFAAAKLVYKTLNYVMLSRGKLSAESQ